MPRHLATEIPQGPQTRPLVDTGHQRRCGLIKEVPRLTPELSAAARAEQSNEERKWAMREKEVRERRSPANRGDPHMAFSSAIILPVRSLYRVGLSGTLLRQAVVVPPERQRTATLAARINRDRGTADEPARVTAAVSCPAHD